MWKFFPDVDRDGNDRGYWEKEVGKDILLVWAADKKYTPSPYHFEFRHGRLFKITGMFMFTEFYRYDVEEAKEACEDAYNAYCSYLKRAQNENKEKEQES